MTPILRDQRLFPTLIFLSVSRTTLTPLRALNTGFCNGAYLGSLLEGTILVLEPFCPSSPTTPLQYLDGRQRYINPTSPRDLTQIGLGLGVWKLPSGYCLVLKRPLAHFLPKGSQDPCPKYRLAFQGCRTNNTEPYTAQRIRKQSVVLFSVNQDKSREFST